MKLTVMSVIVLGTRAKPMLLWYVWTRLVDGAWHRIDDIAKQLRISDNVVSWAGNFLNDHGLAELGRDGAIRLHQTVRRFEDAVKTIPQVG